MDLIGLDIKSLSMYEKANFQTQVTGPSNKNDDKRKGKQQTPRSIPIQRKAKT